MSPTEVLLENVSVRSRALVGAAAAAGVAARLAVYATAAAVTQESVGLTTIAGVVAAGSWLLERALASAARPEIEADLYRAASRSLLDGDVLDVAADDLHRVVWDGHNHARGLVANALPSLVADAVASAALLPIVVRSFPPHMLTAALGALAALLVTTVALRGLNAKLQARVLDAFARVNDALLVAIEGRFEIVARGAEAAHAKAFDATLDAYRRKARRSALAAAVVGRVPLAAGVAVVALVALADASAREGVAATVLGQALLLAAAAPPVLGVVMDVNELTRASTHARPFVELLGQPRRADLVRRRGAPSPELPAEVVADGVAFSYADDRAQVLRDVSFAWHPGEVLVVVGPNGSGKSTLLRLLLGLRAPSRGTLSIAGHASSEIDLVRLRRRAAFLPQRPYLGEPYASVRQALELGAPRADDEAMLRALERVSIAVRLDDRVGELSAGQRQRVALARVLLQNASIVLLDEPDANLDRDGIALVARLVKELAEGGKMVAVAAHTKELADIGGCTVALDVARVGDTGHTSSR